MFNIRVPLVNKNVDICLFNGNHIECNRLYQTPNRYIALGELKGGIDPAGADEHWKTGNTALERIRISFSELALNPLTFFIGGAIEKSMSQEIYNQLATGRLNNATNLTSQGQLASICNWISMLLRCNNFYYVEWLIA